MNTIPALPGGFERVEDACGTVWHADALALLRALPDNSVDLVLTDPPYGNSNGVGDLAAARAKDAVKGGRKAGSIVPIANDAPNEWEMLIKAVIDEFARIIKPCGAICCFVMGGGGEGVNFARAALWLDNALKFFQAIVWDKSRRGDGLGWRYRRNYELIYVSHKRGGQLSWAKNRRAMANVVRFAPVKNELHPTQKPPALIEWLIENHTDEGAIILDPFAGSGTTAVAARNLNRRWIAGDITPEYVQLAERRLAQPYTPNMFETLLASSE